MQSVFDKALSEMNIEKIMEEALQKNVEDAIKKTISDMFTWSGEGKKAIETKIKEEMNVNLDEINFQQYNAMLSEQIEKTVFDVINNEMDTATRKVMLEHEHIKPVQKLSDILEEATKMLDADECDGDHLRGEVSVSIEECVWSYSQEPNGYFDIEIESEVSDGDYDNEFVIKLHVSEDGKILSIVDEGITYESSKFAEVFENIRKVGARIHFSMDDDGERYEFGCDCDY